MVVAIEVRTRRDSLGRACDVDRIKVGLAWLLEAGNFPRVVGLVNEERRDLY
jgi:hypothetical protein